jgi:hypothetical protein
MIDPDTERAGGAAEMTSGQGGGPYGGQHPEGQPGQGGQQGQGGQPGQGWNAPPAPPQGWNAPPPPQSSYPGYGSAPSAPTGQGTPPAMERPTTVRAGIGALIASLILGIIGTIITFADFDTIVDRTLAQTDDPNVTEEIIRTGLTIGVVVSLLILALYVLFLWFAWQGRNWARVVLWVLAGLGVLSGVLGLAGAGAAGQTGFQTALGFFQLILTIAAIVLLALKPSNEWYRFRGWQRATGQG